VARKIPGFLSEFEAAREQAWTRITRFFESLPASLEGPYEGFSRRMARLTSGSGLFKDCFRTSNSSRVVYFPFWHLESYRRRGIEVTDFDQVASGLFVSSFLGACAIRIYDDIVDQDHQIDSREILIGNLCTAEAVEILHSLLPTQSGFWDHYRRFWQEYTNAVGTEISRYRNGIFCYDDSAIQDLGAKGALLKIYPFAAAHLSGREEELDDLERLTDELNIAVQICNDLHNLRSNLENRKYTLPIAEAAILQGYEPDSHPSIDALYGVVALSDSLPESHERALHHFREAQEISARLEIDHLTDYIELQISQVEGALRRWDDADLDTVGVSASPSGVDALDPPDSLEMALAFLNQDPEFRESWEIQRSGIWGQKELIGDVFSRSLILECLAEMGQPVENQIEEVLEQYERNGWRYYRDFKALPPDIDDIAQAIHLLKWAPWDERTKSEYLERPLRWLEANRLPDGRFPVWLRKGIDDEPTAGWIAVGASRCIACEANLLRSLLELDCARGRAMAEGMAQSLVGEWCISGPAASFYYKRSFTRLVMTRCFAGLDSDPHLKSLTPELVPSDQIGFSRGFQENLGTDPLGLSAELLASEPLATNLTDSSNGTQRLRRLQTYDGGWESVPFYLCPGPIGAGSRTAWHGSRLLTSAFAARAMMGHLELAVTHT